jgi:protocatechuate 3,4-dioxygenase, alpha subunit
MSLQATGSQTVGPFFHLGLTYLRRDNLIVPALEGEKVVIRGRVLDGDANPVSDALVEIWQADPRGQYPRSGHEEGKPANPEFAGFGRVATDKDGTFCFTTVKPGCVPGPGGALQAPHIVVTVFARGLLKQLLTRIYFPGESANAEDAVLMLVPQERRATLIARRVSEVGNELEWNITLQGEGETVFFDC